MSDYQRGSEWRRWDLHIHTPKSIVQEYGGDTEDAWNKFIAKLASLPPEIKAIAVTDYLFIDGYEKLLSRRDEIKNIELIVPNIEFRLNTFSGTADSNKRHNFHIIFDPAVAVQDIREQLLNCLSSGYKIQDGGEWRQTPTHRSLQELGKQIKAAAPTENTIHNKSDLEVGFTNITYKREDIETLLTKTTFKGRFVRAIGYSEWDQSRWDQSAAEKRTLINTADFSLTCLDDPAKIDEHRKALVANKLNSLILHSSDSHKVDRIGKTLLWIKADPTFAGLKQVMNEPDARVFIGATPPNLKPDHKVISKITIPRSRGWFGDDFTLDLNRDLIALIGGRGSGKSALAEAIAFGAGARDRSDDAFLRKAAKHSSPITGTEISLLWGDGSSTKYTVGKDFPDPELVRYLPQGVVEELCSHKNSELLQRQIESVIFQALDETQRLGASDFTELRTRILGDFTYEKGQVAKKIQGANTRLAEVLEQIAGVPEKRKTLGERRAELDRLNKSLPTLPAEDQRDQEELARLVELKRKFETEIVKLNERLAKVTELESRIRVFKDSAAEFERGVRSLLAATGITDTAVFAVHIDEPAIKAVLDRAKSDIGSGLSTLREGAVADVAQLLGIRADQLVFTNLQTLNKGIEAKQKETRAFETTKLKYQQQKKTASSVEASIKALEAELATITTESEPEKQRVEQERIDLYRSYFCILKREKLKIEELYRPLQQSLMAGTDTDKKLVFEARINYRLERHYQNGLAIIDRTRRGNFREVNSLKEALEILWDEYVRHDFIDEVLARELGKILDEFGTCDGEILPIADQLRENYGMEEFYNWIFDPTHFEVVSSLTFDGTDLYLLSPGQKGIILLMLYLEIDKGDYRPLIVDQPEENLDNLSVYKDLINYFRDRKQYRQIIVVTHNPNLVVNTDAEQIIVANYSGNRTPRLKYESGSLEDRAKRIPDVPVYDLDDGIIEQVRNILEGGEKAFDDRRKKYQIATKNKR